MFELKSDFSNAAILLFSCACLPSPLCMPCRTRAVAQSAQPLQHLWISDDILSEAFDRFARVSSAERRRRHASNVPGPLEARRRLAKRRMGMTAVASNTAPPDGGFGALFGFRSRPPPAYERGWRWEAPTAFGLPLGPAVGPQVPAPASVEHSQWAWPFTSSEKSDDLPLEPDIVGGEETEASRLDAEADSVEACETQFTTLLESLRDTIALSERDVQPLLDFISSSSRGPQAQLLLSLTRWMESRKVRGVGVWQSLSDVLSSGYGAGTICEDEVVDIFVLLLQRLDWRVSVPNAARDLPGCARGILPKITERLLTTTTDDAVRRTQTEAWLTCLRSMHRELQSNRQWTEIYNVLAKNFRPRDLPRHFRKLPRSDFARILLQHWVPTYSDSPGLAVFVDSKPGPTQQSANKFAMKSFSYRASDRRLIDWPLTYSKFNAHLEKSHNPWNAPISLAAFLALQLKLPCVELVTDIFAVYKQADSFHGVHRLFLDLNQRQGVGIPQQLAVDLVQYYLANGKPYLAYQVFVAVPTVPLLEICELPLQLIDQGKTHGEKIFKVLKRRTPDDTVETHLRTKRRQALKQQLVDLIHLAAYHWAESPHLRSRTAFTRVWECYRYLCDRGAPLTRLMSRAMVKAGITRPLRETKRLNASRVKYVLSIVKLIEGQQVAAELDRLVFDFWMRMRGDPRPLQDGSDGPSEVKTWQRKLWQKGGGIRYYIDSENSSTIDAVTAVDDAFTASASPTEASAAIVNEDVAELWSELNEAFLSCDPQSTVAEDVKDYGRAAATEPFLGPGDEVVGTLSGLASSTATAKAATEREHAAQSQATAPDLDYDCKVAYSPVPDDVQQEAVGVIADAGSRTSTPGAVAAGETVATETYTKKNAIKDNETVNGASTIRGEVTFGDSGRQPPNGYAIRRPLEAWTYSYPTTRISSTAGPEDSQEHHRSRSGVFRSPRKSFWYDHTTESGQESTLVDPHPKPTAEQKVELDLRETAYRHLPRLSSHQPGQNAVRRPSFCRPPDQPIRRPFRALLYRSTEEKAGESYR